MFTSFDEWVQRQSNRVKGWVLRLRIIDIIQGFEQLMALGHIW
jgi:hypothetical protein